MKHCYLKAAAICAACAFMVSCADDLDQFTTSGVESASTQPTMNVLYSADSFTDIK